MRRALVAILLFSVFALVSGSVWADAVLSGNYLRVGVNESAGLIDNAGTVGIQFDPNGGGSFGPTDFITPGFPWEGFSVGIGGDPIYTASGYAYKYYGIDYCEMTTHNTSAGSILSAHSSGLWDILYNSSSPLAIAQDVSFGVNSKTINFDVTLTNLTDTTLTDVAYGRYLDPDQDKALYGTFSTVNSIPDATRVVAVGPYSGWYIQIRDGTGGAVPSIINPPIWGPLNSGSIFTNDAWPTYDPYRLLYGLNDGNGDNQIGMAWDLGDLGPHDAVNVRFSYDINTPEPSSMALLSMSLCGLLGLRRRRK